MYDVTKIAASVIKCFLAELSLQTSIKLNILPTDFIYLYMYANALLMLVCSDVELLT
jgi:hypothetical protein